MRGTVEERFWSKVDRKGDDDCWNWIAGRTKEGYGVFRDEEQKVVGAHRWSYQELVGPIEFGIDHLCRNQACVNPAHMEDVTQAENNRRTTGYRPRRLLCPQGHRYAIYGRLNARGVQVCTECNREYLRRRYAERGY